jgi:hypothetical protein
MANMRMRGRRLAVAAVRLQGSLGMQQLLLLGSGSPP